MALSGRPTGGCLSQIGILTYPDSPNFVIDYYAIDKNSFIKTDIHFTGKVVDDNAWEYQYKFDESR